LVQLTVFTIKKMKHARCACKMPRGKSRHRENTRGKEIIMTQGEKRHPLTKRGWAVCLLVVFCLSGLGHARPADTDTEEARLKASGDVLKELLNGSNGIPLSVLNKAECVIVLPSVKKAGFIVAGQYGRGAMSCRSGAEFKGRWSAPIMMQSSGGSF